MANKIEHRRLADLTPDTRNANKGSERGSAMIEKSLRNYGAGRSILIDKNGKIIAGNKTSENAGAVGMEEVIVVQTDGTKLVAVQRMDLDLDTDKAAKELAIADNRAGQVSLSWDVDVVKELSGEIDLAQFWTGDELEKLFKVDDDSAPSSGFLDQQEDLSYRVVVECLSEQHQAELLLKLEGDGLKCQPLIS
jgi:hypothetical protein